MPVLVLIRQHYDSLLILSKFPIDTKLYELFNLLLHHGSNESKRFTEKIKCRHI